MPISKKRLDEIRRIKDEDINYDDIPEADDSFWANAEIKLPEQKQGVYIRLDADLLEWFKEDGKGYQTRINAVLRSYYESKNRIESSARKD